MILVFTIIYYLNHMYKLYEGFTQSKWSTELVDKFLNYQKKINPNIDFNMNIIQKQATPKEGEEFLKNGYWQWSPEVKKLYEENIAQNFILKTSPANNLREAQTIYNERAIIELLSYKTKEGSFLINGAIIGHSYNLPKNINNIVKCEKDKLTNKMKMTKTVYSGYDNINGHLVKHISELSNEEIPYVVNGFRFKNKPCNPCGVLGTKSDYSCEFEINTGNGYDTSPIWNILWKTNI